MHGDNCILYSVNSVFNCQACLAHCLLLCYESREKNKIRILWSIYGLMFFGDDEK